MMFGSQGFETVPVQGMPVENAAGMYGQPQDQIQGQGQGQAQGGGGMMNADGTPMW